MTELRKGVFTNCVCLNEINVSEENLYYSSQDGVLYNKDKSDILFVPRNIGEELILSYSVTTIGAAVFVGCNNLCKIIIPDGVKSLDYFAFINCYNLTSINYQGTINEWEMIEKRNDFANYLMSQLDGYAITTLKLLDDGFRISRYSNVHDCIVHCQDGDVSFVILEA